MQKDLFDREPTIGETWTHTRSGRDYVVSGIIFNSITDAFDVKYRPLYPCEIDEFSRQMRDHKKAWFSRDEQGHPRFQRKLPAV